MDSIHQRNIYVILHKLQKKMLKLLILEHELAARREHDVHPSSHSPGSDVPAPALVKAEEAAAGAYPRFVFEDYMKQYVRHKFEEDYTNLPPLCQLSSIEHPTAKNPHVLKLQNKRLPFSNSVKIKDGEER